MAARCARESLEGRLAGLAFDESQQQAGRPLVPGMGFSVADDSDAEALKSPPGNNKTKPNHVPTYFEKINKLDARSGISDGLNCVPRKDMLKS